MRERRAYDKWQWDKRIPLALIITLLLQIGALIWGASKFDSRLAHVEKGQEELADTRERLARIEQKLNDIMWNR
jgi:hypothetical protein